MLRIGFVLVLLLTMLIADCQLLTSYELEDLVEESELIIEGEVVGKTPFYGLDGLIYTHYQFKIYSVYKGDVTRNIVDVMTLGGTMEDEALAVCPSLHFFLGETGLIGLRQTGHSWVDTEYLMPVSVDQSWIKINYEINTAVDFQGHQYSVPDFRRKIENLTRLKPTKISVRMPNEAPESMVVITSISPLTTQAGRGKEITIKGSGFGTSRGVGQVLFRDVNFPSSSITRAALIYNSWSDTQIKVIVPYNAGNGSIRVQNNAGTLSPLSSQTLTITYNVVNINLTENVYHIDHDQDGNGGYNFVYSTNTNNGGVDFTSIPAAISAVDRATTTWNSGTSFTIFTEEACGTTLAQEPLRDGNNIFTFDNDLYDLDLRRGSSVLGVMFSFYSRCNSQWELVEMDMVLRRDGNPNGFGGSVNWEYGPSSPGRGQADFESVVLHELGHGHHLGHCRVSGSVMYPVITLGTTKRNLSSSETSGGVYVQGQSTGYVPPVSRGCPAPQNTARQYFDYDVNNKCSKALPLELLTFEANPENDHTVRVQWTTINEVSHDRIELQYFSEISQKWESLKSFIGHGGYGTIAEYGYLHENLIPSIHLYRLAMYDLAGQVEYSEIRSAQIRSSDFFLNANVRRGEVSVEVETQAMTRIEIQIFSVGGAMVEKTKFDSGRGEREMIIPCQTWHTGIYLMKWQNLSTGEWGTHRLFID